MAQLVVTVRDRDWPGGRCRVVELSGEADAADSVLADVLAEESVENPALLVVDLSGLFFMDSSAQRALVRAFRRQEAAGCAFRLVNPVGEVRRLLALTGIDQLIPVYATVDAAQAGTVYPEG